jgi:hypothetical protein
VRSPAVPQRICSEVIRSYHSGTEVQNQNELPEHTHVLQTELHKRNHVTALQHRSHAEKEVKKKDKGHLNTFALAHKTQDDH